MFQYIIKIAKNFINLIYPIHCAGCKKPLDPLDGLGICAHCRRDIRANPVPYAESDQKENFFFAYAYYACIYDGVLKDLVCLFKYKRRRSLARLFSSLLIDFIKENYDILDNIDIITYVPLTRRRINERGFNQSKLLAFNIAREFSLPLSDTLAKIRPTRHQNELSRDERLVNLKEAFKVKRASVLNDRRILLVDDIMTTGATMSECAKVLLGGGAKEVRCLALARGL